MLLHVPAVWTRDEVQACRRALDGADWQDGRATVGPQGSRVKRNRQVAPQDPLTRTWGQRVLDALARQPQYLAAALPQRHATPLFNRHEGGEAYGLHVDGAMRQLPDGGWMRTDLSATLFLCEPDEYDGGELAIWDTYGTHEVKLPAGDLVLYPASSRHEVRPVTRGCRVCSFFWVQSLVPDDAQRSVLFELDMQVQALRAQQGDSAVVLALTGIYHNLLRQWGRP